MRRATILRQQNHRRCDISIHAPLAESDHAHHLQAGVRIISFHAPLAESDTVSVEPVPVQNNFNPRSPCGERHLNHSTVLTDTGFQSTLPLRRATIACMRRLTSFLFQSTLPLRRATDRQQIHEVMIPISIHAPLAESDRPSGCGITSPTLFQSTLPLRRAPLSMSGGLVGAAFQSTLPLRRATGITECDCLITGISIHAPLAESDLFPL